MWNSKEKISIIVQGLITIFIILTICYLSIYEIIIPELLRDAALLILGYWFGSQGVIAAQAIIKRINQRNLNSRR